jgi:uncharacterized protein (DUF58 family)
MQRITLVFFLLLVSIAMAGFNSGNNLLYLISGVMLGAVLVSLIAGRINISGISAERRVPNYVFAGHPFRVTLQLTNKKRFFKSFGISLREGATGSDPLYFFYIESNGTRTEESRLLLNRRGMHRFAPIVLRSNFPFGLFNIKKKVSGPDEMIVYPHIRDLSRPPAGSSLLRDEFPTQSKGPGSGLYGFRKYRHGEEATNISWKLSAKIGKLIVRETEHEERRRVCIVFDNGVEQGSEPDPEAFERAVSGAASLVWYLCGNNYSVKLVTREKVIGYGSGPDNMHRMLVTLALIEPYRVIEAGSPIASRSVLEGGIGVSITSVGLTTIAGRSVSDFSAVAAAGSGVRKQ